MIATDQLHPLPVPISHDIMKSSNLNSSNDNNNNDDNDNNQQLQQQWIITDKMYNNGYKLCLQSMYYAKHGDWDSFLSKFIQKIPVLLFAIVLFYFVF